MAILPPQESILIIEDNPDIQRAVAGLVGELGYLPKTESSGRVGLHTALNNEFALVIIDLGLPELGGMEVCRVLRQKKPEIPILILTAEQEEIKKIIGFELGADEFINKPFSADLLRARIRSLLRRMQATKELAQQVASEAASGEYLFQLKELKLDLLSRVVTVGDKEVVLTPIEFDLLAVLIRNAGRFLNREQLVDAIWIGGGSGYEESLRSHISHLRSKLEEFGEKVPVLESRRGIGYRFVPSGD